MRTRLPPALAILSAALLLSSTEAEGKRLFLPSPLVTMQNYRKEKMSESSFYCLFCFPALCLFSGGFSPPEKLPLLLRFVHFPALGSSSSVFCLIHSVQCCVVSLRLSLRCAVHTATYIAAFQEDQLSERWQRPFPALQSGYLRALPRSPGARACSIA